MGARQRHPHRQRHAVRPPRSRPQHLQRAEGHPLFRRTAHHRVGLQHAETGRHLLGHADAGLEHVPTLAGQRTVGLALAWPFQVRQQVGPPHLHLVHDRQHLVFARGVADRIDIGHRHRPARDWQDRSAFEAGQLTRGERPLPRRWLLLGGRVGHSPNRGARFGHRRAQGQAAPGDAAGALHLLGHPGHQRLVRVAHRAVALQRRGQRLHAGVGHAQGLTAFGVTHPLQPAGGQQFHLDQVLAGPAGRAPDRPQAAAVHLGQAAGVHPAATRPPAPRGRRPPAP
jgi:hypothetical protein